MTRARKPPKQNPIGELTVGQLEQMLRQSIEEYSPAFGIDADAEAMIIRREVEELRARFEDLVDWIADVYEESVGQGPTTDDDRLNRYAHTYIQLTRERGEQPTQELLAEALSVTDRYVRVVGWRRIVERAAALIEDETGTKM